MTWEEIWNGIVDFFTVGGLAILRAIGLWIVGYIVVKIIMLIIKKIFAKTKLEKVTQGFFLSVIKFALYLILIIMVLGQLGVEITGLVAAIAAAGLAIGLALQDSLANVASGVVLLVNHPFKEGDNVNIDGIEGTVKDIKILTTTIITSDNKVITFPNSTVANSPIINFDNQKKRRIELNITVSYDTDVDLVKKVITDVMYSDGRVQLEPAPFCAVKFFNADGIGLFVNCWCPSKDYWDVYYYLMDNIFNEFKRNNIKIPYKQVEVRLRDDNVSLPYREEKLQERVETEKVEDDKEDDSFVGFFKKFDITHRKHKKGKKEKKEKKNKKNKKEKNKIVLQEENVEVKSANNQTAEEKTENNDEKK